MDAPLRAAPYAGLNSLPRTDEARRFVDDLANTIEQEQLANGRTYRRQGGKRREFHRAVGAFLADLFKGARHEQAKGWVSRSLAYGSFTAQHVKAKPMRAIVEAMERLGFIEVVKGRQYVGRDEFAEADRAESSGGPDGEERNGEDAPYVGKGLTTRFRLTALGLRIAELHGITPAISKEHFADDTPKQPLVLRASSTKRYGTYGEKQRGRKMAFKWDDRAKALRDEVKALNAFLAQHEIAGAPYSGLQRVFNEGDTPAFAWNKGGRVYGAGGISYQNVKKAERRLLTINGEATAEVDVSASYLTVLHGLMGLGFDTSQDPYDLPGIDRRVAKAWTVATLGSGKHVTKWTKAMSDQFFEDHGERLPSLARAKEVKEAMVTKYPALERLGVVTWADLMFHESQAIIGAMNKLVHKAIPSLPVHDSLIVRAREVDEAIVALRDSYLSVCGIMASIKLS